MPDSLAWAGNDTFYRCLLRAFRDPERAFPARFGAARAAGDAAAAVPVLRLRIPLRGRGQILPFAPSPRPQDIDSWPLRAQSDG